jgi:hypothetical protein
MLQLFILPYSTSLQFRPTLTPTERGTRRSTMDSIIFFNNGPVVATSKSGTSNTNSSWTWSKRRALSRCCCRSAGTRSMAFLIISALLLILNTQRIATPPKQGYRIPMLPGKLFGFFHIRLNAGIMLEISLNVSRGFTIGDPQLLR